MPRISIHDAPAALEEFAQELLGLQELPRLVAIKAAPRLQRAIDQEFQDGTAPDGTPWAPLKRGTPRTPLSRTGRTREQVQVSPEGTRIKARFPPVMNILQSDAKSGRRPARPVGWRSELPPTWETAIQEGAEEAAEELTRKMTR